MSVIANTSEQPSVRHSATTFWLWLVLVANLGLSMLALLGLSASATLSARPFDLIKSVIIPIVGIVVAIGAFMLLKWKKAGFYIILACGLINILLVFLDGGNIVYMIISAIIAPAMIYYLLQYPKGNKAWSHLV